MNKYQKALDNLVHCKSITRCKECKHKNLCTMERDSKILQELICKYNKREKFFEQVLEALVNCYLKNIDYLDMSVDLKNTIKIIQNELGVYYL